MSVARLSPRQRECLRLYWTQQATSKEIALALGISKGTVDGYFAGAVETLGARDRREAARLVFGAPPLTPPARATGDQPQADHPRDEATPTPPAESGADPTGVPIALPWRSLLPLRTGAHNDLSILARLFWLVGLAVLLAIGFGALANGAGVLSNLLR